MQGTAAALLIGLAALPACVGSGDVPPSVSGQIVGDDERPIGPGLIMVEKGQVHQGAYQTGGIIGEDGRFTVELRDNDEGGTFGLHLFYNEMYSYLPLEITIDPHQQVYLLSTMVAWGSWLEITGEPTWPDQPDDTRLIRMPFDDNQADNPVLSGITMTYSGELVNLTAEVSDPNGDLSRMILAFDTATGNGWAMSPPSAPDPQGNYPEGTYTLSVFFEEGLHVPGQSTWHFIVSDNLCNNTPVFIETMPAR